MKKPTIDVPKPKRRSVLIKRNKQITLIDDVDQHVKTLLSDFLESIDPEEKINLQLDSKFKEIKESTLSPCKTLLPRTIEKKAPSTHHNDRRRSYFAAPSRPSKFYNQHQTNKKRGSIINEKQIEESKVSNGPHKLTNSLSILPVFPNEFGPDGFISMNKSSLITFKTMCDDLKRNITTTWNNIEEESEEEKEKEKTKQEEDEIKYRKLFKRSHQIYDSCSDDEDVLIDELYINPYSFQVKVFDTITAFVVLGVVLFIPIEISFIHTWSNFIRIVFGLVNFLWDIWYIFDFWLGFHTGYIDNDVIIKDFSIIIAHYICSWFLLDFLTAVPYSSIINVYLLFHRKSHSMFSNDSSNLIHLLKLIKILKLFKISVNNYVINEIMQRMLQSVFGKKILIYITLLVFVLIIHVLSCVFIFLGYNNYPNWIVAQSMEPSEYMEVYVSGLYFICLTIFAIGYGDILTTNIIERCYNLLLLTVGLLLYTWLVSALSKIKDKIDFMDLNDKQLQELNNKIEILDDIRINCPKMSNECYFKISRYLRFRYEREKYNPKLIFDNLPTIIQKELLFHMYRPEIENFIFFKNFENEHFIMKVLMSFNPIICYRKERIIHAGDFLEEMYFVKKGRLTIELPLPRNLSDQINHAKMIRRLSVVFNPNSLAKIISYKKEKKSEEQYVKLLDICSNEHYGDIMMFLNKKSPLSVRVSSKRAELFSLKKTSVIEISMEFPKIWKEIISHSIYNLQQINVLIKRTLNFFYENNKAALKRLSERFILTADKKIHQENKEIYITKSLYEGCNTTNTYTSSENLIKQTEPDTHKNERSNDSFTINEEFESKDDFIRIKPEFVDVGINTVITKIQEINPWLIPKGELRVKREESFSIIHSKKPRIRKGQYYSAMSLPIIKSSSKMSFKKYKKKKSFDPLSSLLTLDSKKRSSTLKSIENNIEDNFENLNNPQQFYQKTFSLIKEKKKTINKRLDNIYNFIMHCNSMGI